MGGYGAFRCISILLVALLAACGEAVTGTVTSGVSAPPPALALATTPTPTTADPMPVIIVDLNDSGSIRSWQKTLNDLAETRLALDGIWGPATRAATSNAQAWFAGEMMIVVIPVTADSSNGQVPQYSVAPAAPVPVSNCDPNYAPCVPIASDVDCASGSGNGPAYVWGPVRVVGTDVYGLDRDHDGVGCE